MRKNVTMKRKIITRKDAPKRIVLRRGISKAEETEGLSKRETSKRIKRKGASKKENEDKQEIEDKQKVVGSKKVKQKTVVIKKSNKQEATIPDNKDKQDIDASKKTILENELPKKDTGKNKIKSCSFFKDLFEKYSIIETSDIYEEFDLFKKSHLEKLSFLNDQMLETYRLAFFYKFYKLKIQKIKYCGKAKVTMFNNALNEIKIEPRNEEQPCDLICNLYSILHPLNRNSS